MKKNQNNRTISRILYKLWIILLLVYPSLTMAQQLSPSLVSTAGETFSNGSTFLDFSIGEVATELLSEGNNLLSQGFLQGASASNSINQNLPDNNMLIIYPNPAKEKIFLQNNTDCHIGKYNIINIQGRSIAEGRLSDKLSALYISNLKPGLYLITIQLTNQQQVNKLFIKQ